jgi:hypothetical protein
MNFAIKQSKSRNNTHPPSPTNNSKLHNRVGTQQMISIGKERWQPKRILHVTTRRNHKQFTTPPTKLHHDDLLL